MKYGRDVLMKAVLKSLKKDFKNGVINEADYRKKKKVFKTSFGYWMAEYKSEKQQTAGD